MTETPLLYSFYKSCFDDKLITLSLTAAHSEGSKGADYRSIKGLAQIRQFVRGLVTSGQWKPGPSR